MPTRSTSWSGSSAGCAGLGEMTTVEAAFYGACDGELTVGQIADALAMLLDYSDVAATRVARCVDAARGRCSIHGRVSQAVVSAVGMPAYVPGQPV